jgi:hypothetical protein
MGVRKERCDQVRTFKREQSEGRATLEERKGERLAGEEEAGRLQEEMRCRVNENQKFSFVFENFCLS